MKHHACLTGLIEMRRDRRDSRPDLGMNPATFNEIFMIARAPRLIAHVIEEQTHERPMRRIDPVNHGYDGPPPRNLSGKSSS